MNIAKFAIVATVNTVRGKRDEYLKHLKAHAQRCLATRARHLENRILVPQKEADTIILYEAYASLKASEAHGTGTVHAAGQAKQDTTSLQVSLGGVRCDFVE